MDIIVTEVLLLMVEIIAMKSVEIILIQTKWTEMHMTVMTIIM